MSKPMKRSAFFLSAAIAGLFAVYAPASWSDGNDQQSADAKEARSAQGMDHGAMKGMDHSSMKGMNHDAMKGMDHGSMQGMDHGKMMESHGSNKAKAGKDAQ